MAPTAPKSATAGRPRTKLPKSVRPPSQSIRTRTPTKSTAPKDLLQSFNDRPLSSHSSIPNSKRDKRQIKHSLLLSRLKGATASGRIQKKRSNERANKRKRTQLTSKLDDLRDVLPEDDVQGQSKSSGRSGINGVQTLRTKPGHTKRLGRLKQAETDRFQKNMAAMSDRSTTGEATEPTDEATNAAAGATTQTRDPQSARWSALRAHIMSQQAGAAAA